MICNFIFTSNVCLTFNRSNTTGATSGPETAYPSGAHESTPILVGFVSLDLEFSV